MILLLREHAHAVEHKMYVMSGRRRFRLEGSERSVGPDTAMFVPLQAAHSLTCGGNEPLRCMVIYAPGGPEQELCARGEAALGR